MRHATLLLSAAGLLAGLTLAAPVGAAIYTVGIGTGCTHATLQQAINAAEANPGADTIRVTRSQAYSQQAVVINTAQELDLVGGFATCSQATSDGIRTTLSGAGVAQAPVLRITGQTGSVIRLRHLRIEDGTHLCCDGGGIYYTGNGRIELAQSDVAGNSAGYGAGIYAKGTGAQAELVIAEGVLVVGNSAVFSGGGIYLDDMNMRMEAPGSMLFNNEAQGLNDRGFGGGLIIRAENRDARALVGSNGIGSLGTISGNTARYGGGVAIMGEGGNSEARLDLFSTDPSQRTAIRDNFASVAGGGLYGRPTMGNDAWSSAVLWNADLLLNVAPDGAAAYLEDDSFLGVTRGAHLRINARGQNSPGLPPAGVLPCPEADHCGLIVGNQTRNASNQLTAGAIIRMNRSAELWMNREWGYPPPFNPAQRGGLIISGNVGGRLIDLADNNDNTRTFLRNLDIHGNTLSQQLLRASGGGSYVDIQDSTVADNAIGAAQVLSVQGNLRMQASLIWQPGKTVLSHSGGTSEVLWSLANESASLGGGPGAVTINSPRFIDPARGDYRLRAASPAIDYAPPVVGDDRDTIGLPRDQRLPAAWRPPFPNPRTRDAGAYERQVSQPMVINGDFDVDLNLWPQFSGGVASTWDGSQNAAGAAGSGSVFVNQTNIPQRRVIVRLQCIHLPGPGRYLLNGWGRSGAGTPGVRDTILLHWQLRHDGGEACTSGLANQDGDHVLTTANSWNQPANPAAIDLPVAAWTPNSSILVQLVVNDNGVTSPLTATGWFDGITLTYEAGDVIFADGFD